MNFGTTASDLQIFMDNSTVSGVYELGILSLTSTSISAVLPGGHVGTYYIRIKHATYGNSYPANTGDNKIVYEIVITSVTP